MFNYAFIVNSKGMDPESYSWKYENGEMDFRFFATSGLEMTKKYSKKLADEGFKYIDLCGDFTEDDAKQVALHTESRIEVEYAKYFESELKKLERLPTLGEYGIIIMGEGIAEGTTKTEKVIGSEFNTTIIIVGDDETAKAAAQGLVDSGVDFMELCSYFNEIKAGEIIEAINGAIPVGYCG